MNMDYTLSSASKARAEYIDFAKGLVMTSVIWGHILTAGWSLEFIYSFHMPFFFFVSGMLFKETKYPSLLSFLKSRWKTLIKPYLLYSFVIWCFWATYQYLGCGTISHCWKSLFETFLARSGGGFFLHNSVLWFIPCLLMTELLYFFIRNTRTVIKWSIIVVLVIVNSIFTRLWGDAYALSIPYNVDSAIMALPFYAVGHYFTNKYSLFGIEKLVYENQKISWAFVIAFTIFLLWAGTAFGMCSIGCSRFGYSEITFYLRAFIGCATTIVFSILLTKKTSVFVISRKIVEYIIWIGRSSIDFMCTHIPIKGVIVSFMAKILCITTLEDASWNDNSMFHLATITFIITMIIDSVLVYSIRKYIKKI